MTIQEAEYLVFLMFDTDKLGNDSRITQEEIHVELRKSSIEGVSLIIDISCRCFEGQLSINENGDLFLYDDNLDLRSIDMQSELFLWLIAKRFDVFGLIKEEIAVNKTTLA